MSEFAVSIVGDSFADDLGVLGEAASFPDRVAIPQDAPGRGCTDRAHCPVAREEHHFDTQGRNTSELDTGRLVEPPGESLCVSHTNVPLRVVAVIWAHTNRHPPDR